MRSRLRKVLCKLLAAPCSRGAGSIDRTCGKWISLGQKAEPASGFPAVTGVGQKGTGARRFFSQESVGAHCARARNPFLWSAPRAVALFPGGHLVEVGGLGPRGQGSEREAGDCPTNRFLEGTLQKPWVRLSPPDGGAGKQLRPCTAEAAAPSHGLLGQSLLGRCLRVLGPPHQSTTNQVV